MKKIIALCLSFFSIYAVAEDEFTRLTNHLHRLCLPALIRVETQTNPNITRLQFNEKKLEALIAKTYNEVLLTYKKAHIVIPEEIKKSILKYSMNLDSHEKLAFILCALYGSKDCANLLYVFTKCAEAREEKDYEFIAGYLKQCRKSDKN